MPLPIHSDNFSWSKFSVLLGQPVDSSESRAFLFRNHLDSEGIWQPVLIGLESTLRKSVVDTRKIDIISLAGILIQSKHARLIAGIEGPGSVFVFSDITYFAEGEADATQFRGSLPYGVAFSDTDDLALKKVPYSVEETHKTTDGTYFSLSWNCETYKLHAVFLSATRQLRRVICYLPQRSSR